MKTLIISFFALAIMLSFLVAPVKASIVETSRSCPCTECSICTFDWLDSSNPTTAQANSGNVYHGNDTGTRNYSVIVKFNVSPYAYLLNNITNVFLRERIEGSYVSGGFANFTIYGSENQTWRHFESTYNNVYNWWNNPLNNVTLLSWNDSFTPVYGQNLSFNVTDWFKWIVSQSKENITFWINHTVNSTGNNAFGFVTTTNYYLDIFYDDTYAIIGGLNASLKSAWNNSAISGFTLFSFNGSINTSTTTASDNVLIPYTSVATGTNVTIVVTKSGYANVSYIGLSIDKDSIASLDARIVHQDDMIHATSPTNTTYYSSSVLVGITTPPSYGNMFNLKYSFGGSNYTLNSSSSMYSGYISVPFAHNHMSIYAENYTSQFWYDRLFNKTIHFSNSYSLYNINIRDEMTGYWLNISPGTTATLTVSCPTYINITSIVSSSTQNFTANCENPELKLQINTSSNIQYRTLTPAGGVGNLTFYMINFSTHTPVFTKLIIEDLSGEFSDSMITITKPIPTDGSQTISNQETDSEAKILTYLIDGETYQVTINNGIETRSIGNIRASAYSNSVVLKISEISINPSFTSQWNQISYSFFFDQSNNYTAVQWNDRLNMTTSIYMVVYNATNYSQVLYTSPVVYGSDDTLLSWSSVPVNTSIRVKFVASHQRYGTIEDSRLYVWITANRLIELGMNDAWYLPISIFLIITFVLLFSVYDSEIGLLLGLFLTGMLWYWGWLNPYGTYFVGAIAFFTFLVFASRLRSGER